jgi:hypothetical protein
MSTTIVSSHNVVVRLLSALVLAALAGSVPPVSSAVTRLDYTFKTRQGPTTSHPHPPPGGRGDTYDSSLVLKNAGIAQFGKGQHAPVGAMRFTYTIRQQCTSFAVKCVATADFETVTTLPGGTVVAGGKSISIASRNIRIPVIGGTGRYKGAKGTVTISPTSTQISTYRLTVP